MSGLFGFCEQGGGLIELHYCRDRSFLEREERIHVVFNTIKVPSKHIYITTPRN